MKTILALATVLVGLSAVAGSASAYSNNYDTNPVLKVAFQNR